MNRVLTVVLAGVVLMGAAQSASALGYGHIRDGWSYGFGLGVGWTQISGVDVSQTSPLDLSSNWEADFSGDIKVAFSPNDQFSYGLGFSGWSDYTLWGENYNEIKTTTLWILLQGHWYPGGKGLYLRGGVGLGSLGLKINSPLAVISQTKGGVGWELGTGYEIRVSPSFAIGLGYDYRYVNVGSVTSVLDDVTGATQTATMSFTWYAD